MRWGETGKGSRCFLVIFSFTSDSHAAVVLGLDFPPHFAFMGLKSLENNKNNIKKHHIAPGPGELRNNIENFSIFMMSVLNRQTGMEKKFFLSTNKKCFNFTISFYLIFIRNLFKLHNIFDHFGNLFAEVFQSPLNVFDFPERLALK